MTLHTSSTVHPQKAEVHRTLTQDDTDDTFRWLNSVLKDVRNFINDLGHLNAIRKNIQDKKNK